MVKAFAPANISCIFSIVENKDLAKKGSKGVGFTLNKGVIVSVKRAKKNKILYNNKKIRFSTVESVIKKLNKNKEKIEVKIKSDFPLSVGFGISGASALATAYALNKLLKLKKTRKQLAKTAHIAEVENNSGLGDVVNQFYGGFLIKTSPSSEFKVKKLPIKNKIVYYKIFSKLDTKKVITNKKRKDKINKAGLNAIKKIKKNSGLKEIIKVSKQFSIESDLLKNKKVINLIKSIEKNKGNASMIMLGNAVFSDKKFKGCNQTKITDKGACLL